MCNTLSRILSLGVIEGPWGFRSVCKECLHGHVQVAFAKHRYARAAADAFRAALGGRWSVKRDGKGWVARTHHDPILTRRALDDALVGR